MTWVTSMPAAGFFSLRILGSTEFEVDQCLIGPQVGEGITDFVHAVVQPQAQLVLVGLHVAGRGFGHHLFQDRDVDPWEAGDLHDAVEVVDDLLTRGNGVDGGDEGAVRIDRRRVATKVGNEERRDVQIDLVRGPGLHLDRLVLVRLLLVPAQADRIDDAQCVWRKRLVEHELGRCCTTHQREVAQLLAQDFERGLELEAQRVVVGARDPLDHVPRRLGRVTIDLVVERLGDDHRFGVGERQVGVDGGRHIRIEPEQLLHQLTAVVGLTAVEDVVDVVPVLRERQDLIGLTWVKRARWRRRHLF